MPDTDVPPAEPPPSYQQATGSSSSTHPNATSPQSASATGKSSHLEVPGAHEKDGIPMAYRRSMEDEGRPLPAGWVRTFDPESEHQFFVDTTKDPPRSIWVHPYDDDEYLSTLTSEERERIEDESMRRGHPPSKEDIMAAHTDEEDEDDSSRPATAGRTASSSNYPNELPPREGKGKGKESKSFGRKFKDKVTGMTHEQREAERAQRAEQERQAYERHRKIRQAMATAQQTGKPQYVGKDRDGKDVYIEPPAPPAPYGGGYGYGSGYGYNPYQGGVYTAGNSRYIRPPNPYSRPYGGGYGGGYGTPLGLGLGGGLLGGLLIGDAIGGFGF